MPARTQDHVHRLISSMSPAEKRYYKLHIARYGQEHGIQELLFNAIADMKRYDEDAMLAALRERQVDVKQVLKPGNLDAEVLYQVLCDAGIDADAEAPGRMEMGDRAR